MNDAQTNQTNVPELTSKKIEAPIFQLPEGCNEEVLSALMATVRAKRMDTTKKVIEPELLIGMGKAPILYRGSMCFVCGQAGTRKTTALTLLCSDLMKPGTIPNSPFTIPKALRVLFVDTEQADFDAQQINIRVKSLIGTEESIYVYPLIDVDLEFIPAVVEQLVAEIKPDVCVIDNVAHMGHGFVMDIEVAELLVRNLRRLAVRHNAAVIGVIHMNEGTQTSRPRGHGGSEAVREADLVFQFIEDESKEFSVAEAIKARRMRPQKWGVSIDENGKPYYHDVPQKTPTAKATTAKAKNPDTYAKYVALLTPFGMAANEFGRAIDEADGVRLKSPKQSPRRTTYDLMAKMAEAGAVAKVNGRYYKPQDAPENETELPF